MIELISTDRCISCGLCVKVCPTNVFDEDHSGMPFIARQEDCQTCFMCEAYCPVDAMYVAPFADDSVTVDEDELADNGLLGSWRATIGWGPGRTKLASIDQTLFLRRFRQQGQNR